MAVTLKQRPSAADKECTMARATQKPDPREIAHRASDGLEVALLWSKTSGTLTLSVTDARNGDFFELPVERDQALAAFHHPFAFAAARGVDYRTAARDPGDTVYA
jgi:hypothetical protein